MVIFTIFAVALAARSLIAHEAPRSTAVDPHPWRAGWNGYLLPMSRIALNGIWRGMIARCDNPQSSSYERYGARGINVCDRWRESFDAFADDMGPRPSPEHSIDRKNNNGDYTPKNCRWATKSQQSRNTRKTVRVKFRGKVRPLAEWVDESHMPYQTIFCRLLRGWDVRKALTQSNVRGRRKRMREKVLELKAQNRRSAA